MRVELPGDNWAELRGLDELRAKDKVAIQRAIEFVPSAEGTPVQVNAGMQEDMQMALLKSVITSWSYGDMPVKREQLEELPLAAYNALCEATTDHLEVMRVVPNRRTPPA